MVEESLPHWSAACKLILLVQPSSAAAEHVFFVAVNELVFLSSKPLHWRTLLKFPLFQYNSELPFYCKLSTMIKNFELNFGHYR